MLARRIEAAGIPTVVVTNMPQVAEARHASRIVGVEFPFSRPFGVPGDRTVQRTVHGSALVLGKPARVRVRRWGEAGVRRTR